MALTARQRRQLKALAHHLQPVVRIGRARLTPAVIKETERTLQAHELIKIRLDVDEGSARKELATALARETGAEVVSSVGKVAVLFRQREEKPKIKLEG